MVMSSALTRVLYLHVNFIQMEFVLGSMGEKGTEVCSFPQIFPFTLFTVQTNCVDTTITNLLESTEVFPVEVTGGAMSAPGPAWRPLSSSAAPALTIKVCQ